MANKNVQNEEKILKFWEDKKIFQKSVEMRPKNKPYVFYDGPPFATGLPHYGHIVASLMKDIVPRYWTMKGFRVERKWGWDCHGLPIENIIEKNLGLKSRQDIESYGVLKFNNACHNAVLTYAKEWKKVINRMGRWVDMEDDYKTMDIEYMESVWWVFSELWKKKLIYQGHKAMHICPRCETPLSNFEVTQGYKDIKDLSVTAKFQLKDASKLGLKGYVYILAWTTTPWTLPGNLLLAVGKNIKYLAVKTNNETVILAKERLADVMKDKDYEILKELKGQDLLKLEYKPLFPYFADTENAFHIATADFVTTKDGTGIVHIAPAFGEDDYNLGKIEHTGWVQHVGINGRFTPDVKEFAGIEVKPKEDPTSTDLAILKWLAKENKLFSKEKYEHSYPYCWRCDSPLINYATNSWFVHVTKIKKQLLQNNKQINWVPKHIKEGRFGKWLKGARDWAVSRNRFWGAPLPIWQSKDGDNLCIGSVKELEKLSGKKITDIHKHLMDKIVINKNGKEYKKVPEVLDCWFESGSMPYGQMHYPFENKKLFETGFPAEFIAEGQDQTRGWFYTLHILATALTLGKDPAIPTKESVPAFKNVIVNGIVLAEDGKKMSKKLKNYPDPMDMLNKYGADAMRYYLGSSSVMHAENICFNEDELKESYNKVINTLRNVADLYLMYNKQLKPAKKSNLLDQWILAKLENLLKEVEDAMINYKLAEAIRPIQEFITDLSQWYVRRSRKRIKSQEESAIETLGYVLLRLSKIIAPFTPFISENIYQSLNTKNKKESVHLEAWPVFKPLDKKQEELLKDMEILRNIVEVALSLRAEAGIKVRQPLSELNISGAKLNNNLLEIAKEELNVKAINNTKNLPKNGNWLSKDNYNIKVALNTLITEELKEEGYAREIIRSINALRKDAGLTPKDNIILYLKANKELEDAILKHKKTILQLTISSDIKLEKADLKFNKEIKLNGNNVWLGF